MHVCRSNSLHSMQVNDIPEALGSNHFLFQGYAGAALYTIYALQYIAPELIPSLACHCLHLTNLHRDLATVRCQAGMKIINGSIKLHYKNVFIAFSKQHGLILHQLILNMNNSAYHIFSLDEIKSVHIHG